MSDQSLELKRARQLFGFLKAFAERRIPTPRVLAQHAWTLGLRELPDHPSVVVGEVILGDANTDVDLPESSRPLLRVARPRLTRAPRPPEVLNAFLVHGWESATEEIRVHATRSEVRDRRTVTERFEDDPARVSALAEWRARWEAWAQAERPAVAAMRIFERLSELKGRIDRESEQLELILGDGCLKWQRGDDRTVEHPLLLQRVELHFDPDVPAFEILDADRSPELYSGVIADDTPLTPAKLKDLRDELEQEGYHPLAQPTSVYLRRLAQLLSPRGIFLEDGADVALGPDPVIVRDPVLFLRTRPSGYAAAFDRILAVIDSAPGLPVSLARLVGVDRPLPPEEGKGAGSPWGEPDDVLLSKPANSEQIQIARALDRHRAILVQGPPGTGKSHTIANLIGHLVSQGKRVLVTSHTTKALRVLRSHVVEALQPLCVAVLESDAESRSQMEDSVRRILSKLTAAHEEELEREIETLREQRRRLNEEVAQITADLRTIREDEYRPIVVAGEAVEPAEASRYVVSHGEGNDWLPGPLEAVAPLPLSSPEVHELYRSNEALKPEEDSEIAGTLPDLTSLPTPASFSALVAALAFVEPEELASYWERVASEDATGGLERLATLVRDAARELDRMEPWQRSVVAAGHAGGAERELWMDLSRQIEAGFDQWEESRALLLEHEVSISPELWADGVPAAAEELRVHVGNGGSLGYWSLLGKPTWKKVLEGCTIEGRKPSTAEHFQAIAARLRLGEGRRRLQTRWIKQASPIGMPKFEALGDSPERVLPEYGDQVDSLLDWWTNRWTVIEDALGESGFRWSQFRSREVARSAPLPPFDRDAAILGGPLLEAVSSRREAAKRAAAVRRLADAEELLVHCPGEVSSAVRGAVRSRNVVQYERALSALVELSKKEQIWRRRRQLIGILATSAPEWAQAVLRREGSHGAGIPPGDPATAWRWRQLQQEILRRAKLDEVALGRRLRQRQTSLRETTTQLIDRLAWLGQLRRTDLNSRIALEGWSQTVRKVGKGTGKRVPQLQARARGLLIEARDAVPVWIMPLSRVAESFDPAQRRFDVVIIDESSQSDVTGLLAWYLGEQIAVVGDHEQVSPLGVGEEVEATTNLIAQYLTDIPNSHLYDGRTSVYDLARTCFGGAIALREHFRCVPDIIGFSDELSYNSEIRPLRAPRSAPRPHVVEYVVDAGKVDRSGKTNLAEARAVVALLKAATELREYRAKSLGAITLLGDEQAGLIQDLAVRLIGPVELDRRRFLAGNSAQFQGDERDIVFLSMVDTRGMGPLHLRHTDAFKQRYNVAASRARDQLWLVHSLDPVRDLKEGDLRRRLIEYVRDPGGRRKARDLVARRAESPFERTVAERLIAAGYRVSSQVTIGSYRIDLVVTDESSEVAIECDGDRYHGLDDISDDMARQAVLERAGWRFIRIRGTRFFRDPDKTMEWVIDELERLGVGPAGFESDASNPEAIGAELRERVIQRAFEIMRQQTWVHPAADA